MKLRSKEPTSLCLHLLSKLWVSRDFSIKDPKKCKLRWWGRRGRRRAEIRSGVLILSLLTRDSLDRPACSHLTAGGSWHVLRANLRHKPGAAVGRGDFLSLFPGTRRLPAPSRTFSPAPAAGSRLRAPTWRLSDCSASGHGSAPPRAASPAPGPRGGFATFPPAHVVIPSFTRTQWRL